MSRRLANHWLSRLAVNSSRPTLSKLRAVIRFNRLEERDQPATFMVTNVLDSGAGSFREAVVKANGTAGADVIDLTGVSGTISLLTTLPNIAESVAIKGPGASTLTIQRDGSATPFRLLTFGGVASLSGLKLTNGSEGSGGCVYIDGRLTITNCELSGNTSTAAGNFVGGGAVFVEGNGQLTVVESLITGNNSAGVGGGIFVAGGGDVTLRNSTLSNNVAAANNFGGGGGGIYFGFTGRLLVSNCTISGNTANGAGGGVYIYPASSALNSWVLSNSTLSNNSSLVSGGGGFAVFGSNNTILFQNCTVTENSGTTDGGGVFVPAGYGANIINLQSTIVSGNKVGGIPDDIGATNGSQVLATNSAIGDAGGFALIGGSSGNLAFGLDLKLGSLANNGGATMSHLPAADSPVVDAGYNVVFTGNDQRGFSRNVDDGAVANAKDGTDIGAVEVITEALAGNIPSVPSFISAGAPSYQVKVVYTDNLAVDATTIDGSDLTFSGPSGIKITGASATTSGPTVTATYTITPMDNSWDPADIGTYTVSTVAAQVKDTLGNPITTGIVGQFRGVPAPQVFTVINTANAGAGSLRQAILDANASTGTHDTIAFAISTGLQTISPTSALPTITDEVTIDGWTQPGYSMSTFLPVIQLNGTGAGAGATGLWVQASNTIIRGLVINRYSQYAILIRSGDNNTVQNCFLNVNQTGTAVSQQATDGAADIWISESNNNLIGGSSTQARNVISGSKNGDGILLVAGSNGNVIQNNRIGTNLAGTITLKNGASGVAMYSGCGDNLVTGNLISGNATWGVYIGGLGSSGNQVRANFIGTNVSGSSAIANGNDGVVIFGGALRTVVGTNGDGVADASESNVISGNLAWGVRVLNVGTDGTRIAGNVIGAGVSGTSAIPNSNDGVVVHAGATNTIIGTNGDGIADAIEGNVISGNVGYGIQIVDAGTDRTRVAGNIIGLNAAGNAKLQNNFEGLVVHYGPHDTIIGTNGDGVSDALERNVVSGNASFGITIARVGTVNTVVAGNLIGTDITGKTAIGNGRAGVWIFVGATNSLVGTNADGVSDDLERNIISGNGTISPHPGVLIDNRSADPVSGNVVVGNYIGTDITGTMAIPNTSHGVHINDDSGGGSLNNNIIGGATPKLRNVISGNAQNGVAITGVAAANNVVMGNYIGTTFDGKSALPNNASGVLIANGATNNRIGTNADGSNDAGEANVISGNILDGVHLDSTGTAGNIVAGNRIGTDIASNNLGNGGSGVAITDGVSNTTIGGSVAAARNIIAFNGSAGVTITGAGALGNLILGNRIYSNAGLGIDLGDDGPTPNDPLDADLGPNTFLNTPTLTSATAGATTTVSGSYSGAASTTFTLAFYASAFGDEGQRLLGTTVVMTDGTGAVTFTGVVLPGASSPGEVITATSMDGSNNTSEFSNAVQTPGGAAAKVSAVVVNNGELQRSQVTVLTVTFNEIVTFSGTPVAAFGLKRQTDSAPVTLAASVDDSGAGTVVTLTFIGGAVDFNSLADGRYTLTVDGAQVSNANGNLDGDNNGSAGGNYELIGDPTVAPRLFRLYGDSDGNGTVTSTDFAAFRSVFGLAGPSIFDANNDGIVNSTDFAEFRKRFGVGV